VIGYMMKGLLSRSQRIAHTRTILWSVALFAGIAWAQTPDYRTKLMVKTDKSNAFVYVDGQRRAAVGDPDKGKYSAIVNLNDFREHRVAVGTEDGQLKSGEVRVKIDENNYILQERYIPFPPIPEPPRPPSGSVRCPACSHLNPPDRFICDSCREKLKWVCREPGCNAINPIHAARCSKCGSSFLWQEPRETVGRWGGRTLGVLAGLVVCWGLVALVKRTVRRPLDLSWPHEMAVAYPSIRPAGKIAEGGIASIWLAKISWGRWAVVKILHPKHHGNESIKRRFLMEERVLRELQHTGVVPRSHGRCRDGFACPWYAMTYLRGMRRLRDVIGGPGRLYLEKGWALHVGVGLCESVQKIHRAGVVHRDLSPENVMYTYDRHVRVYLIDFDSAKPFGKKTRLETIKSDGSTIGKVNYTAPEQWQNFDAATTASDAYSVGIMIWESFLGSPPFTGDNVYAARHQHETAARDHTPLLQCGVSKRLAIAIVQLLHPLPEIRPTLRVIETLLAEELRR